MPARADDLADFNAAVERAAAHNRVAIGYLRTGNVDLAGLELDRLREAWALVSARKRPDVFRDSALYTTVMTDNAARLVSADMMMNMGKPDVARTSLLGIRDNLYNLRKSAGIVVLADCVKDANKTMDRLFVHNRAPDLGKAETTQDIAAQSTLYGQTLARCDGIADAKVKQNPEFRRLIDGAKASLALIPKALAGHDTNLLHRVLIELRSFDNLLAFRFG
jgi:hypothetical protein